MRTETPGDEEPVSWKTIRADTPVYSSDNQDVGSIHEVLGSEQADIFHGIVVHSGLMGKGVMVAARDIAALASRRIDLSIPAEQVRALEPYKEEESYHLGIVGLFRHKLGWVPESRDPE